MRGVGEPPGGRATHRAGHVQMCAAGPASRQVSETQPTGRVAMEARVELKPVGSNRVCPTEGGRRADPGQPQHAASLEGAMRRAAAWEARLVEVRT